MDLWLVAWTALSLVAGFGFGVFASLWAFDRSQS